MQSDAVRRALAITPASTARERTIDITTTGRRSGRPHRIEVWFFRAGGQIYLSSVPGRKDWYANLEAKQWHGLRRFRLRGLDNVNTEGLLIAAGQNLKRWLVAMGWGRRNGPCGSFVALLAGS